MKVHCVGYYEVALAYGGRTSHYATQGVLGFFKNFDEAVAFSKKEKDKFEAKTGLTMESYFDEPGCFKHQDDFTRYVLEIYSGEVK